MGGCQDEADRGQGLREGAVLRGLKCQAEESGCLEMMEALLILRITIDQLVDIHLCFIMCGCP